MGTRSADPRRRTRRKSGENEQEQSKGRELWRRSQARGAEEDEYEGDADDEERLFAVLQTN